MAFLANLTKRKKSPEQLVKLALASLHDLPLPDETFSGNAAEGVKGPGRPPEERGTVQTDELLLSWSSLSSTTHVAGVTSELHRGDSNASDGNTPGTGGASASQSGATRRPSFFLQKSRFESDQHDSQHVQAPCTAPDADSRHKEKVSGLGSSSKHSISVPAMFFSDPGKRSTSSVMSPALHHTNSLTDKGEEGSSAMDNLSKRLGQIKQILYGDSSEKEVDQHKCEEMGGHVVKENLMPLLMEHFVSLPFETRKDAASIFNNLCRHNYAGFADPYLCTERFELVDRLMLGYSTAEISLVCGTMLRECLKYEKVARRILFSDRVWVLFDNYVHLPNFDVASDAFTTLKELLTRHKHLAAEFLEKEYEKVSEKYKVLLQSENYVTRRMSLKMLGELLVERTNFTVMMRYISSKENLKAIMMLLRDKSGQIQFENQTTTFLLSEIKIGVYAVEVNCGPEYNVICAQAFQIFKVFVANPKKPPEIIKILVANRDKLVTYLEHFQKEKAEEQFREEKALLIATLNKLHVEEEHTVADATDGHHQA